MKVVSKGLVKTLIPSSEISCILINEMLSFHFSKFCLSQSQDSRREREFCPLNLEVRDENEIFLSISQGSRRDRDIFFQVSCFEMGLRDEINLILTRIFEIEKSRYALVSDLTNFRKCQPLDLFFVCFLSGV